MPLLRKEVDSAFPAGLLRNQSGKPLIASLNQCIYPLVYWKNAETNKDLPGHIVRVDVGYQEGTTERRGIFLETWIRKDAGQWVMTFSCPMVAESIRKDETDERVKELMDLSKNANRHFILASAPVKDMEALDVLAHAKELVLALGALLGSNSAGDAEDAFHRQIMLLDEQEEEFLERVKPWRIAWLGKVCERVQAVHQFAPEKQINLVTIKGGPECDHERAELERILLSFKTKDVIIELHHFANLDELFHFLKSAA